MEQDKWPEVVVQMDKSVQDLSGDMAFSENKDDY